MTITILLPLIFWLVLPAFVAYWIVSPLARSNWWLLLGATLGWIGVLVLLGLTRQERRAIRDTALEEEDERLLAETGEDAETRKLRRHGLSG
jgi:hypothetical protein